MKYKLTSIWDDSITNYPHFKQLNNNISTDVCIIGGGITGISTGYYLNKNNIDFVILERNKVCESTTKFSTAKVTSQHDLIYTEIIKKYGIKKAKLYLEANNEAIKNIQNIIQEENIDCDFEIEDSYVFTQDLNLQQNILNEYKALSKLDFKNVELLNRVTLPLNTKYAIKFKNQAKFNPKKYTLALANIIKDNIYENSHVTRIDKKKNKIYVHTKNGIVTCNKVVLATHYPIKDIPGFYFTKMYQDTSYMIAVDIQNNALDGMYISLEEPTISLRTLTLKNNTKNKNNIKDNDNNNTNILLIGGNGIKTGDVLDKNKYTFLEKIAKEMYPDSKVIKRWNTQDCITLDKIPYIGKFSIFYPNIYVATGFNKWGMTTSNIAASIITDNILNKHNKYEEVFKATRLYPLRNIKQLSLNILQVIQSLIINKFKIKKDTIDNIPLNTGKIIKENNVNIGIYKDENGKIYKINPYCSHLKCLLTFNTQDKTWDCPCHGSRFDIYGNLIYGPANENITEESKN